jgi:SAM-dependent methyltransferase
MKCRLCDADVERTFLDLGMQPLSNAYVRPHEAEQPEMFYPLHVRVCERCLLVQLPELAAPSQIFKDYAYLSSTSSSWVAHAGRFVGDVTPRFGLNGTSRVIEVASNDGYLLRHFQERGIPVLGIEPAANVADIARAKGVPTLTAFFTAELAQKVVLEGGAFDLVVANNVLAHVPDLNGFVRGLGRLLAPGGVLSVECPHLLRLLEGTQFDTIYHEHFSYFSLGVLLRLFTSHGLEVFDVEPLSTHGGSLRVFAQKANGPRPVSRSVASCLAEEERDGGLSLARYDRFAEDVVQVKRRLLGFLIEEKAQGHRIAAYGAPAKGNTLLNFAGVRRDFIDFVVDRNTLKQGTLLPGTRIPVFAPERIREERPDVVLLLPWNLETELAPELRFVREWGGRVVIPVPDVRVLS